MAKQSRTLKATNITDNSGSQLHQTETLDDNLLPDAAEIERLSCIDPTIIEWLKARAEKEQDFRHKAYHDKMKLLKDNSTGERVINYMGMTFSFIFLCLGIGFSYLLIKEGHLITGSIFSGVTLLYGANLLLAHKKNVSGVVKPRQPLPAKNQNR